ncbi:MAG: methyltransferase [Nocardioidaceae bacterium]|nr:methyltransferase [Nocardioidaceae bacterium]
MASPEQFTVRSGRVKHARRLATRAFRSKTREFIAEGPQAVREALTTEGAALEVFATQDATDQHRAMYERARATEVAWHVVEADVVAEICDTVQPQGLVARCAFVDIEIEALLAKPLSFVLVCADIRDPGNAGAVIRCADAAGAEAVILAGDSVDAFNPKAVRASVGSVFHVPIVMDHRPVAELLVDLSAAGLAVLAADGAGDTELFAADLDLSAPTAWLMGNEAWGIPAATRALADKVVAVPIYGQAESLNLATAAAVCLYATARARHTPHA